MLVVLFLFLFFLIFLFYFFFFFFFFFFFSSSSSSSSSFFFFFFCFFVFRVHVYAYGSLALWVECCFLTQHTFAFFQVAVTQYMLHATLWRYRNLHTFWVLSNMVWLGGWGMLHFLHFQTRWTLRNCDASRHLHACAMLRSSCNSSSCFFGMQFSLFGLNTHAIVSCVLGYTSMVWIFQATFFPTLGIYSILIPQHDFFTYIFLHIFAFFSVSA